MQSFLNIDKSILPACGMKVLPKVMFSTYVGAFEWS